MHGIRLTASFGGTAAATLALLLLQLHIDSQAIMAVAASGAVS
jgi:hypothetical protein